MKLSTDRVKWLTNLVYDVGNSGHLVAAFPRKEVQFVEITLRWNYEDHQVAEAVHHVSRHDLRNVKAAFM